MAQLLGMVAFFSLLKAKVLICFPCTLLLIRL